MRLVRAVQCCRSAEVSWLTKRLREGLWTARDRIPSDWAAIMDNDNTTGVARGFHRRPKVPSSRPSTKKLPFGENCIEIVRHVSLIKFQQGCQSVVRQNCRPSLPPAASKEPSGEKSDA